MRRREFITLMSGAVAWPVIARAQQPDQMRRIGVLMNTAENDPQSTVRVSVFARVLEELGWKIGRNVQIEYRWAAGAPRTLSWLSAAQQWANCNG